jgi:pimeloyl-ACP methyl ester carboxylesterase
LRTWIEDLEAVVEAQGLKKFPLFGMSQGGAIAIAYAARHPERVSHLILFGAYGRGVLRRNIRDQEREEAETLVKLNPARLGPRQPGVPAGFHVTVHSGRHPRAASVVQ